MTGMSSPPKRRLDWRLLGRDTRGAVIIWFALATPAFLGLAGLGMDVSTWFMERRIMQSAVDTAALAASHALAEGGGTTEAQAAANDSLAQNQFGLETADVFTVVTPPTSGPNAGDANAVEVVLRRKANLYLVSRFVGDGVNIRTRAVGAVSASGDICVLGLDESIDSAVEFRGTSGATLNCGIASNSRSDKAIHIGGTTDVVATSAQTFGDIYIEGSATLLPNNAPLQSYAPAVTDPYGPDGLDLQVPVLGVCDPAPVFGGPPGTAYTVDPGHYCGDFLITKKDITFNPGTYIIEDGNLEIKAHSTAFGDGVTFILTSDVPDNVGTVVFSSSADIDFTAPTTGPYAGIVIFEDPIAAAYDSSGNPYQHEVVGGATTSIKGAIYAPSREIRFAGGGGGATQCLQLVGRKVTVTGNAVINNDPSACGAPIREVWVKLTE
jgi:Flp pilus assembly protein TadG